MKYMNSKNQILVKQVLASSIKLIKVYTPEIAQKANPGQFVIIRVNAKGERFPLTIVEYDSQAGTITLIFQEVGVSTIKLGLLKEKDIITDVIGPLGNPTKITNFGQVVCIGGGIGIAPIYPIVKNLKKTNNRIISIIGTRTKNLLILEKKIKETSDEIIVTTDDGSCGRKGLVIDPLKEILQKNNIDRVYAIGPVIMMQKVCEITRKKSIKTIVSLNPIMVDGTGMCGACRVTVNGKTCFACIDGPEFDGHLVDFNELLRRQRMYLDEEKYAVERINKRCLP